MWKVPLFELNFDDAEAQAVQGVIDSQWLTMGEQIKQFEDDFSGFLGADQHSNAVYSTAVSSCTAALHMALLAADVKPGDEVIIPALTFIADMNVVSMVGASPVLADCAALDDWNVSAETLQQQITDKTKAMIIVHFAGYPCQMDAIVDLCRQHNIVLIEDVAHAPGASINGRSCGTWGDMSCFSFFTNKNLSIGEGGMFVTGDQYLSQQAGYLRSHGMTSLTLDRHKGRSISYDVARPGLNYRMDEIRAALGLVQLAKLPAGNAKRGVAVKHYHQRLAKHSAVSIPFLNVADGCIPAFHIYPILLGSELDRLKVIEAMKQAGIQTSIHYPSFREFSAYQHISWAATPIADEVSKRVITLPLYPGLSLEKVDLVCDALLAAIATQ
jgi:dTDP-4-amino-4,6-dideoxygalactose transaminase